MVAKIGKGKFVKIDLPADFVADMRKQAKRTGCSLSEQIVHYAEIGQALEQLVPESGSTENTSILAAAVRYLMNPDKASSLLAEHLKNSSIPQFGADPENHEVILMVLHGKVIAKGVFDGSGNFVPILPPIPVITGKHKRAK